MWLLHDPFCVDSLTCGRNPRSRKPRCILRMAPNYTKLHQTTCTVKFVMRWLKVDCLDRCYSLSCKHPLLACAELTRSDYCSFRMRSWLARWWSWASGALARSGRERNSRAGKQLLRPPGSPKGASKSKLMCVDCREGWSSHHSVTLRVHICQNVFQ